MKIMHRVMKGCVFASEIEVGELFQFQHNAAVCMKVEEVSLADGDLKNYLLISDGPACGNHGLVDDREMVHPVKGALEITAGG